MRAFLTSTLKSGPMPLYTTPMLGVMVAIFCTVLSSTRMEGSFFSVAITTPSVATMPSEVAPAETALSAYSIWTSLPLGLKVVSENEYCGAAGSSSAAGGAAWGRVPGAARGHQRGMPCPVPVDRAAQIRPPGARIRA